VPVHDVAATGFDKEAGPYDRARPSYPDDAVAWIAENLRFEPSRTVADVAAGTGKLTRLLVPFGASIVAVEPIDGMRAGLRQNVPEVVAVAGTAEALPFADESLDAITVAQAFHWFDAAAALREFGRVLAPRGRLALVWNARDRTAPLVDAIWSIMDRVERDAPWRAHDEWHESAFVETGFFGPLHEATFANAQLLSPEGMVERVQSVSHVAVLPRDEQEKVLDEVRSVLATHPDAAGRSELTVPYRVDAYWCERA
jgi:SAM-dependent methyltransferase